MRIYQIVGDPTANPPIPALIPVSRAAWWKGVKDGKYPKGIKLGPRTTCWDVKDVRALVSTSV